MGHACGADGKTRHGIGAHLVGSRWRYSNLCQPNDSGEPLYHTGSINFGGDGGGDKYYPA